MNSVWVLTQRTWTAGRAQMSRVSPRVNLPITQRKKAKNRKVPSSGRTKNRWLEARTATVSTPQARTRVRLVAAAAVTSEKLARIASHLRTTAAGNPAALMERWRTRQ